MKYYTSNYNPEYNVANVWVQHLGHIFNGAAHTHPQEENPSEFVGCEIAERRAVIKALKYERNLAKENLKKYQDFVKACECYKDWNKEDPSAKIVYRQLNRRIKQVNDLTEEIKNCEDLLKRYIVTREVLKKRLKEKKEKSK